VTETALSSVQKSLFELHLQRNRLQTLPRVVFDAENSSEVASVLRVLDLSSNPLGPYVDLLGRSPSSVRLRRTLEVLRLRDVGMARWPTRLLRRLDGLTMLDVGENRLTTIPDGSLAELAHLERLDASLNRINGVDPWRLMAPSTRHPPKIDLSGNPLDCTCSLTPLCRHMFPLEGLVSSAWKNDSTPSRTLYSCRTPAEWHGRALAKFCTDADSQCSTLPTAVLAASLGATTLVVVTLTVAIVCRRCVERRRRGHVPGGSGTNKAAVLKAAAVARCRGSDSCYQFVDETSLTSSSNSSSAATTTSGVPVPPPSGLHHTVLKPPTNYRRHDDFLLASARQWL